jgi:hypothetical protein
MPASSAARPYESQINSYILIAANIRNSLAKATSSVFYAISTFYGMLMIIYRIIILYQSYSPIAQSMVYHLKDYLERKCFIC